MDGVLIGFAIILVLFALDVLAFRVGVDSTYDSNDPHSPAKGLV